MFRATRRQAGVSDNRPTRGVARELVRFGHRLPRQIDHRLRQPRVLAGHSRYNCTMKLISDRLAPYKDTRIGTVLTGAWQFSLFAVRRFFAERFSADVAALTYSTLLALVPLLVIAFAILSSFPAFEAVKGRMQELFFSAVVPEAGAAVADYLSRFTENASNLTVAGIVALAVTAVLLLSTIEETLNRVWHVERPRPMLVRILIFWAILTMGPLLIGGSFTMTSDLVAMAARTEVLSTNTGNVVVRLHETWLVGTLISVAFSTIGFTALFVLVPARRVRIRHAVIGALFAAISFEILSWGFNSFYTSGSSYETIYGAVAAVPVFLIWIYTSWMVIVLGAVIAASLPDWFLARQAVPTDHLRPPDKLAIAVTLIAKLYRAAQSGGMIEEEELSDAVPLEARDEIFDALVRTGYLAQTEDGRVALVRDMHTTRIFDLASDLQLPLGAMPERDSSLPVEILERIASETSDIRDLLKTLHESEVKILGQPIADIVSSEESPPTQGEVENIAYRSLP
jgi:membrane protein